MACGVLPSFRFPTPSSWTAEMISCSCRSRVAAWTYNRMVDQRLHDHDIPPIPQNISTATCKVAGPVLPPIRSLDEVARPYAKGAIFRFNMLRCSQLTTTVFSCGKSSDDIMNSRPPRLLPACAQQRHQNGT